MSLRHVVEIGCDGPDAHTDCPYSNAESAYGTAEQLRAQMAASGRWRTGLAGGDVDRCFDCFTYPGR